MSGVDAAGARRLGQFLRTAVVAGVESAVQVHIERGDDLNARDASGMTPLMLSAARNKPAICRMLLCAGADHGLLDPSGRTALEIAIAAGSDATAAVLEAVRAPVPSFPAIEIAIDPPPESSLTSLQPEAQAGLPGRWATAVVDETDDGEFDLSGWEAEEEPVRPETDLVVVGSASAVQIAITAHKPIDSSTEWDDIEAHLPEVALPLARADDAQGRARLRRLLLRALREGSVPSLDVEAQSANEDRSASLEAEAYLTMIINDLGAEVDERFEYSNAYESFEVFVDPEETPDEEAAVEEALFAIDRAASPRHEPLRIYQREFQRLRLLTAEEEITLAKDMEAALETALDALAAWPDGLKLTVAAGKAAIAGARQLSSVWVGGEPEPELESESESESESASLDNVDADASTHGEHEDSTDDGGELTNEEQADAGGATFGDALHLLAASIERADGSAASTEQVRQALAGLRLNRRFLLELTDAGSSSASSLSFGRAMAEFRKSRDRMAAANLKLAFFHAKKWLHSGEPLDDLAQEGNIGLLKAVDRYDWRRGFRFSTYATWWIRQQISRYVADKVRTIRVPVHVHEKLQRAERMAQAFEMAFAREPTLDELAERAGMPREKLAALLRIAPELSPIHELTVDGMIAIDAREAYVSPDPADVVDEIQLNRAVDRYISSLSSKDGKEEQIVRLRFGIGDGEALTLEEVGRRFQVTRERIRQIEAKTIKKLQHPVRSVPFARTALGLRREESPLAAGMDASEGADVPDAGEPVPPPSVQRRPAAPLPAAPKRPAAPRLAHESTESTGPSKPSELDRILAQAAELGIHVDDDRLSSGRIWVELVEARENKHRRLVRRLLEFGFEFWPGKGYWR